MTYAGLSGERPPGRSCAVRSPAGRAASAVRCAAPSTTTSASASTGSFAAVLPSASTQTGRASEKR